MAASCWHAFDEINFFRVLQCFFFSILDNHLCIYTKTIIRLRLRLRRIIVKSCWSEYGQITMTSTVKTAIDWPKIHDTAM